MQKRRSVFPKSRILFLFLAALILGISAYLIYQNHPSQQFERANKQLFIEEMTASTLNMHYTIADPKAYGISKYKAILPCYDKDSRQLAIKELKKKIQLYNDLEADKLSSDDVHTLTLLKRYLNNVLTLSQYPYHEDPLSPSSGMQSQLPILLAEYTFRSLRDVDDYLDILSQTKAYFSSLLQFETEKKEAGLLTAATTLRNTAAQCRIILTKEALDAGTHFLQITFADRLQNLSNSISLTEKEINAYINRNNQILFNIMLPAYEQLAQGLESLADPSISLAGLASKPDGAAYYAALLRAETGSSRSSSDIRSLLASRLESDFQILRDLLSDMDTAYLTDASYQACSKCFPLSSCEAMLKDLRTRMDGQFPSFPEHTGSTPVIHVKEVAACLEEYCAPAFYLIPPLDDSLYNSIYINTSSPMTSMDLYTTLAHEGFPGHLYQTLYSNLLQLEDDSIPIKQLLSFSGYQEGWALYVEFMAYDYASQIMEQSGHPEYATLLQIEKHNRSTQLCLFSLLDILIHHENADLSKCAEILAEYGITNSATVCNIYEYIVEEPANYPKYYLGYLEILLLKERFRQILGADYSDYAFHKFFLDNGPADFETLNELLSAS